MKTSIRIFRFIILSVLVVGLFGCRNRRSNPSVEGVSNDSSLRHEHPAEVAKDAKDAKTDWKEEIPVFHQWREIDDGDYYFEIPSAKRVREWKALCEKRNPLDSVSRRFVEDYYADLNQFVTVRDFVELWYHEDSRIGDDELDIIIGDVSGERPDLETCELYREKMAVIIPKKPEYAPLAEALQETGDLRHLASWPMITNTRNDIVGRYISQVLLQNHIPPNIAAMSDIAGTCLRLCAEGVGVYLCPDLYIRYFKNIVARCVILPLPYSYMIHMAARTLPGRQAATEKFMEYVEQKIKGVL